MQSDTPEKDRREAEAWLHEAIELSLYERFAAGPERALIAHGSRSGKHPDFALLDVRQELVLVELKRGRPSRKQAEQAVTQALGYVSDYEKMTLGELAALYCQHGVDVNTALGYRGKDYIQSQEGLLPGAPPKHEYGRLNRWSLNNLRRYRRAVEGDADAFALLQEEYWLRLETRLELTATSCVKVSRCILIAEDWPRGFPPKPETNVELWSYKTPAQWVSPWATATDE